MKYRVKCADGHSELVDSLDNALVEYCRQRHCDLCRLSPNDYKDPHDYCDKCDPVELLRRFGDDIEVIHDGEEVTANSSADLVNHPTHYNAGGIECIDAMEAAVSCQKDPASAVLTAQVIKYLWRFPLKNGVEDLQKARWYLDRLIDRESRKRGEKNESCT